ncbi:MAG: hypothetical protein EOP83_33320 [Verrucomicrobiaceae bacterium]|nr:MAG: hypothetical protein EOP83_33320 [Verrucomicrobiaceae bacterium]
MPRKPARLRIWLDRPPTNGIAGYGVVVNNIPVAVAQTADRGETWKFTHNGLDYPFLNGDHRGVVRGERFGRIMTMLERHG